MLHAFNVELTLVVCGFRACCSLKNPICTRTTAHNAASLREQIILGSASDLLNVTLRTDFPKLTTVEKCCSVHDKQEIPGHLGWKWSDCWLLLWCPESWSSLGGVSAPSISKCRTRNRLRFIGGGGEQSTQVLRRGAAKIETKVLFKVEAQEEEF